MKMKTKVILLAGGKGTRMRASVNKVLLPVCGKTVIRRSLELFDGIADEIMVVCRAEDKTELYSEAMSAGLSCPLRFTSGGNSRQESVLNGLTALSPEPDDIVLIHDAARCLADRELILRVVDSCIQYGSGIPAIPVTSTYKICDGNGLVIHTPDRTRLFEIQTPQGFIGKDIMAVAVRAADEGFTGTDDASLFEHYGYPVRTVQGSPGNIKLTSPEDMATAETILEGEHLTMRIGMGYDVHQLAEGRKLLLCGVEIPWQKGLLGHSDADVALHALMDAMLGACALGDIGTHFPDTDPRFKGISSLELLKRTDTLLREEGFHVCNADITIVAQQPKILPYIREMTANISAALKLDPGRISVKATTTEKLGFEGRMEGISSYAVCTVSGK